MLAHDKSSFLSHLPDIRQSLYGIIGSSDKPTYCPKHLRYSTRFGARNPPSVLALFPWFLNFPCDGMFKAFSILRGFAQRCTNRASKKTSIFWYEPPISHFCAMHSCHGPTSMRFDRRSSLLCAGCKLSLFRGYFDRLRHP